MIVDVLYEGLSLAKGATAREESGGTFIELESPLPVGSRLTVQGAEGTPRQARVERVQEGLGGGVLVKFLDAQAATAKPAAPAAAPAAQDEGGEEASGAPEPDKPDEPSEKRGPGRKERRGKNRKTASSS